MLKAQFRVIAGTALALATVLALVACTEPFAPSVSPSASGSVPTERPSLPSPRPSAPPAPTPTFNKALYSIDDPTSVWVVTNKLRALQPADYVPSLVTAGVRYISNPEMRPAAASALVTLFAAGAAEGAGAMQIQNAYRSFVTQTSVHNRLVASLGASQADAQSARPGYSEHQTGLAVDITALPGKCSIQACFGELPQGVWLAANAWRFGFLLRYPADKTAVTGYIYEPWHFRYVGIELSTQMHLAGISTLEEFFGLPNAPAYAP